jgi:hypothetical protein
LIFIRNSTKITNSTIEYKREITTMDGMAFVNVLLGKTSGNRFISCISFDGASGPPNIKHFSTAADAAEFLRVADAQKHDAYVRITPLKHIPARGRGTKEDSAGSNVLWVDLDVYKMSPPLSKQEGIDLLKRYSLPPSLIIDSGYGLQAYWILERFLSRNLPDSIELRNRTLAKAFGADDCWDLARVLRPPGSHNYKQPNNPQLVTVVHYDPAITYSAEQFPLYNVEAGAPTPNAPTAVPVLKALDLSEQTLPQGFLESLDDGLRKRILEPTSGDRSANDHAIAVQLLKRGFSPGQLASVLTSPVWPCGEKFRRDGRNFDYGYLQSTVESAVALVAKERGDVTLTIQATFKSKTLTDAEKATAVLDALESAGHTLLSDGTTLFIIDKTGRFVENPEAWLAVQAGTSTRASAFQLFMGMLIPIMIQPDHSRRTQAILPWCTFYNGALRVISNNQCTAVDRLGVSEIKNGTDRVIQLPGEFTNRPLAFDSSVTATAGLEVLFSTFGRYLAVAPNLRSFITAYTLALPLLRGMPFETFPVMHLTGDYGRGKSQTLKMITAFLYGQWQLHTITVAAANRIAAREIILPFDDYELLAEEQRKFILNAATGAGYTKASGTYGQASEKVQVHVPIALTSKRTFPGKNLRRRTIEIEVDHIKNPCDQLNETDWEALVANRSFIWSGYFRFIQLHIIPALPSLTTRASAIALKLPGDMWGGLRGFLALLELIVQEHEKLLPGKFPSINPVDWFEILFKEQQQDDESEDPILDSLHKIFNLFDRSTRFNGNMSLPSHMQAYWGLTTHDQQLSGTASEWHETMTRLINLKDYNVRQLGIEFARLNKSDKTKSSFQFDRIERGGNVRWSIKRLIAKDDTPEPSVPEPAPTEPSGRQVLTF